MVQVLKVIVDKQPEDCKECPFYHRPFTIDDNTCTISEWLGYDECILEVENAG